MFILKYPINMISFRLAYVLLAVNTQAGIKSMILHSPGER